VMLLLYWHSAHDTVTGSWGRMWRALRMRNGGRGVGPACWGAARCRLGDDAPSSGRQGALEEAVQ